MPVDENSEKAAEVQYGSDKVTSTYKWLRAHDRIDVSVKKEGKSGDKDKIRKERSTSKDVSKQNRFQIQVPEAKKSKSARNNRHKSMHVCRQDIRT
ncbi:unnamed protein product [Caenorhabditis nigoni]